MRRCPECRRDYYDETLIYCLDDGARLVEGPSTFHNQGGPADPEALVDSPTEILADADTVNLGGVSPADSRLEQQSRDRAKGPITKSRTVYLAAAAVAILVLAGFLIYLLSGSASRKIDSVAVLPFENASGDPDLDYLSDGVSESVIDRLSQVPGIKVIARSSSFRYRGNHDPREVAEALGVGAIITGRVVQRGDSVSIRVELIDARENKHWWGENFVRPMSDVHVLQNDISRQIADILRIRLSATHADQIAVGGTKNHEAYELFLRGRFFFHRAGAPENFRRAALFFEQAIAVDPDFAMAHALLSDAYGFGAFPPDLSPGERESLLERITQRAIDLAPQLAEAHSAMANYRRRKWQWETAKASSLRAIELNPNLAQAINGYAFHLTLMGQHEAALESVLRARELDPISLVINTNLGNIYMRMGRQDEAIEVLQKTIGFGEPAMFAHRLLGSIYMMRGMNEQAFAQYEEALRISGNSPGIRTLMGVLHVKAGRRDAGENIAREIRAGTGAAPPELAVLLDSLGQRDEAFAILRESVGIKTPGLPLVMTEPVFQPLANDDRFRSLLGNVGLPVH